MARLGYHNFGAAGSDWGTSISTMLALRHREHLTGIHLVPPLAPPDPACEPTPDERAALKDLDVRAATGSAYSAVHATVPQTISYALADSPAGLCAWIADKYWAWVDHDGDLYEVIDRDRLLDCISIYWHTRSAGTSARLYWESIEQVSSWITGTFGDVVTTPAGCSIFGKEVPRASRRWADRRFCDIQYWKEHDRGGHFAALEQPELLVEDLSGFFGHLD